MQENKKLELKAILSGFLDSTIDFPHFDEMIQDIRDTKDKDERINKCCQIADMFVDRTFDDFVEATQFLNEDDDDNDSLFNLFKMGSA